MNVQENHDGHDPVEIADNMLNLHGREAALARCDQRVNARREPPMGREFWRKVKAEIETRS